MPVDWTIEHDEPTNEACGAFLGVEDGVMVPEFGNPGQPLVCLLRDAEVIEEEPTSFFPDPPVS